MNLFKKKKEHDDDIFPDFSQNALSFAPPGDLFPSVDTEREKVLKSKMYDLTMLLLKSDCELSIVDKSFCSLQLVSSLGRSFSNDMRLDDKKQDLLATEFYNLAVSRIDELLKDLPKDKLYSELSKIDTVLRLYKNTLYI